MTGYPTTPTFLRLTIQFTTKAVVRYAEERNRHDPIDKDVLHWFRAQGRGLQTASISFSAFMEAKKHGSKASKPARTLNRLRERRDRFVKLTSRMNPQGGGVEGRSWRGGWGGWCQAG